MADPRIVRVEWGCLTGQRPRAAGSNARLGPHGERVSVPLVCLSSDDGATGFGLGRPSPRRASALLGVRLGDVFSPDRGVAGSWRAFDYALWDLAGKRAGRPVYALAARAGRTVARPYRFPCYDTSLYFDDLHVVSDEEAAAFIGAEARAGYARGHRAFKIKVGRGARHLPVEGGTRRDIAVIRAVRAAVGPDATLMLDANDGYTLNLAKRVLRETAECRIFWLEEAFHEDAVLYADLRAWLNAHGLPVLIADGEGESSPDLLRWARRGLIDVVQYDIGAHGFTGWLRTGRRLGAWGVRSAPHHYGTGYGNYAAGHLAGAIDGFAYAEWDEAAIAGLDSSGYALCEGQVSVPEAPGFGLALDEAVFQQAIDEDGFRYALRKS